MDRNEYIQAGTGILNVALRKESVDRNMICLPRGTVSRNVALRKESVDRNTGGLKVISFFTSSLSARRAWIEIGMWLRLRCHS